MRRFLVVVTPKLPTPRGILVKAVDARDARNRARKVTGDLQRDPDHERYAYTAYEISEEA